MKLSDVAKKHYNSGKNCAEAILLASKEKYNLGLTCEDTELVVGFGGGMGCGSVCGTLAGAIAVLGKMYSKREDFRPLCAKFVKEFEVALGCNSHDCRDIAKKHKNEETKCVNAVIIGADTLEKFINEQK